MKKKLSFLLLFAILPAGIYAFLAKDADKVDVSDSFIIPENYEDLLVLDILIPHAKDIKPDTLLHNGQAGSSVGDELRLFTQQDRYSDHNGNGRFDGNQMISENEATVSSSDDLLDSQDYAKNTGLALLRPFKYSGGIFEQYVDDDSSVSYTDGEAIIRSSSSDGILRAGNVVRNGKAGMKPFPSDIKFVNSIEVDKGEYSNGESIIKDAEPFNQVSDSDVVITPGDAGLKSFSGDFAYSDSDGSGRYSVEESIIIDKNSAGILESVDTIVKSGNANLRNFDKELYSDSDGNGSFDAGEMIVSDISEDMKVKNIKKSGFANLRLMADNDLTYSDDNSNNLLELSELIVRNSGNPNIIEPSDSIVKPGKANLLSFEESFIDNNGNGLYNNGECIVQTSPIVSPQSMIKAGSALLLPFSARGYLFTDENNDGKYTGDINPENGYQGEAIFRDLNSNGLLDQNELITTGRANIRSFASKMWFIDVTENSVYDNSEAIIMSGDDVLSVSDTVIKSGPAFLRELPDGTMKWSDVNANSKYDEEEIIITGTDDVLSPGEVIKPGVCGLKNLPLEYNGYVFSDSDGNNNYSKDSGVYEVIFSSKDMMLDSGDSVIKPGTANLRKFRGTSMLFIDSNISNDFNAEEAIINNHDPVDNTVVLDNKDEVLYPGYPDIRSFEDDLVYIDNNGDTYFQGDSDCDVTWDRFGNPMAVNDPHIIDDGDEVLINEKGANRTALDSGDVVVRPGMALLTSFSSDYAFTDNGNGEYDGDISNEAIIKDNDLILDETDEVIVAGISSIRNFGNERFIDSNNDLTYTPAEAIWRDSGNILDRLDPDDEIVKSGYAALLPMSDYKYMNDGTSNDFTGNQALILDEDWILDKSDTQIKPGEADVNDFRSTEKYFDCDSSGTYSDGEPIAREDEVLNPGTLASFPNRIAYIDSDKSGLYNALGSPPVRAVDIEAVIKDNGDREINSGPLDGTGGDSILIAGTALIKTIDEYASLLVPQNPEINAYIDRKSDYLQDFDVLITDNNPRGILDKNDIVWGKVIYNIDNKYYWSGNAVIPIDGSTLIPPKPSINAYIDSYEFNSLSEYEVLITDNEPVGKLDDSDIVWGEIKDPATKRWENDFDRGIPWRFLSYFNDNEKFLTSASVTEYNDQPIINEKAGNSQNTWDSSDLIVYDGSLSKGFSSDWGMIRYIDDNHNGFYDYYTNDRIGECIVDLNLTPPGWDIIYPDIVVTPGKAGFGDLQANLKYIDLFPKNGEFNVNEAIIEDSNANNMIDPDEVIFTGMVGSGKLSSPLKYIDSDLDNTFSSDEAIIKDNGNGLFDAGRLDSTGIDQVISMGKAGMRRFGRTEKFVDGNVNKSYDAGEAIVYDWHDPATYEGEFILAGDHPGKTGQLMYLAPGNRNHDCVLLNGKPGSSGMQKMNDRNQKYIDNNHSGSYNGFYDIWNSIDYEPIIFSIDNKLDTGRLDGTGIDKILSHGYCLHSWPENYRWSDSNHDNSYQNNEAVIYNADNSGIIRSIGAGINDDRIIVSGDADLRDFSRIKYIDANGNGTIDIGTELIVKDHNDDNIVTNDEISDPGIILFLQPFVSSNYRYCDWNIDNLYDPQEEAIIYTPNDPENLDTEDEIVSSGLFLTAFDPKFIDYDNDSVYDYNEAVIIGNGDQIIDDNDQIIVPGYAPSFDGTNYKYAALSASDDYVDGFLIADDDDNILQSEDIITAGKVNLKNFNESTDRYSDNNHNAQYDSDEAIVIDKTGNTDIVEAGEIETEGYAGLKTFADTAYKYSDAGDRDQRYDYGELLINDLNGDNKASTDEILDEGIADLKGFSSNVMYTDYDRDGIYSELEAIVLTDDNILQGTDSILADGRANMHVFEENIYRFADANNNSIYDTGEAIIVESGWGNADNLLEDSDIVLLEGDANLEFFPNTIVFLDIGSGFYESGTTIIKDLNDNKILDTTDEIITEGKANLRRFTEKYSDGGDGDHVRNSLYDSEEAIIRDGNDDNKISAGRLDAEGIDSVITAGKAGLKNYADNEKYVDASKNSQYDGNEDIYLDEDNNGIVTGDDYDRLKYIIVENNGTATSSDIAKVKLWADRDDDGKFEPATDDFPLLKNLISDASNKKWYEGPAFANSTRAPIGYPISIGKRFFVTVSTGNKPKDGSTIQFGIPLNGVSTVYGSLGPSDISIANAYVQTVDSQAPSVSALISPAVNEVIYGQITLSAAAEDSVQVGRVEFFDGIPGDNNLPIAFDEDGPPWQAVWDCSNAGFGAHTLYVRVFDKTNRISHYRDSSGVPVIIGLSRSIPLYTGWNFISISLESFDPNVSSMLSSIGSNARSIWAYDAISSKWLRYDLDGPSFLNDLEKIGPYTGYQLFMNAPGILKVSGTPPEKTIALHSGWNLVGFNSQEPLDIIEAISSITAYNPVIWILDAQTGQWMNYDPKNPNNDLSILEPGKAYWFHVDGDCVWELE